MIGVAILGSTGSIGLSTLDVIQRHPDRFQVIALTAHTNVERMWQQVQHYQPCYVAMTEDNAANQLRERVLSAGLDTAVLSGALALETLVALPEVDSVMAAIVGIAGLPSSLAAARAGKRVLLANKESLVVAGALFMQEVERHQALLLPIDSEHNALFQCMPSDRSTAAGIRRILLTASGGPFRQYDLAQLAQVTPAQACAHPNWSMGPKISVDSATMMNKGLEVIEAHWLFGLTAEQIEVVVHPQSIVHSLVDYLDGSVLAQLGNPDMRTPIAHALAWPQRIDSGVAPLDLCALARLDFAAPDLQRFRCLQLAYDAVNTGGSAPAVLNGANEAAVAAFLDGRMAFLQIPEAIDYALQRMSHDQADSLEHLQAIDRQSRELVTTFMARGD